MTRRQKKILRLLQKEVADLWVSWSHAAFENGPDADGILARRGRLQCAMMALEEIWKGAK